MKSVNTWQSLILESLALLNNQWKPPVDNLQLIHVILLLNAILIAQITTEDE